MRPACSLAVKNVRISAVTTATRIGTGIRPNTSPPIVFENDAGRPETARASVTMYTRLRRMACVPSVMMKGGRPVAVTRKPFTMPMAAPNTSTPRKMASRGCSPPFTISCAVSAPESAMVELTLKSMPPRRMAKNSPRPSRMVMELCSIILTRLLPVRKLLGRSAPNMAIMRARIVMVL